MDSQRSSLSFGIGRAGFVSADVNLRDWNVKGESRGLISPSFPSCTLQIESRSIYIASSCADTPCACVIAAADDRGAWNQNTPQGLSVDYYRLHASLAIMTIARATFDGTPNSVLKPRPRRIFELKAVHGLPRRETFWCVFTSTRLFHQSYVIYIWSSFTHLCI